jgi:hypothetical protein
MACLQRTLITMLIGASLSACGGGGGGGNSGPPPPFAVTSFSPASALPNASISIQGTGLANVASVTIGGVAATISAATDSQLTIKVPAAPMSGTVTLTGSGYTSSAGAFTALPEPIVSSASAPYGAVGSNITLTGQNLNEVATYSLAGVTLKFVSGSATSATLTLFR